MIVMRDILKQTEVLQMSIYCEIIFIILQRHKKISIAKLLVFSYLFRMNNYFGKQIYNMNNKQDVLLKALSLMKGDFEVFCNTTPFIIKAMHLLVLNNIIKVEQNMVLFLKQGKFKARVENEDKFITNAISESCFLSDKQFLKEVLSNV